MFWGGGGWVGGMGIVGWKTVTSPDRGFGGYLVTRGRRPRVPEEWPTDQSEPIQRREGLKEVGLDRKERNEDLKGGSTQLDEGGA